MHSPVLLVGSMDDSTGEHVANFQSFDDVAKWVSEHNLEDLRDLIASPAKTHPKNREVAAAWLRDQIAKGKVEREDEAHDFMRRQTLAAEESARSAGVSARWAVIGGVVAVAMLVATAWPYFKLLDLIVRLAK